MSESAYRLVFTGELCDGESREAVQQRMADLFGKESARLDLLFNGERHILKNNLTLEQATDLGRTIEGTGALVAIEAHPRSRPVHLSAEQVLERFHGRIEPVHVTPLYLLAMAGVTVAMLLLPLLYLALIGLSGYGVYLHAVLNTDLLGHGGLPALVAYLGPIVVGAVLLLFMLKPFLLFRPDQEYPVGLLPESEQTLFAFVHRICDAVGACRPRRIRVDNQVNASAGFYHGLHGLLRNELVLTIGLPLAAGLNQRQLAGILAHEFGHFSQVAAMRMSYLINWVNHWLYRAVYQRDIFDHQLERWAGRGVLFTAVVLQAARLFVWLVRRLLWLLMNLGGAISSLMSRQMEFDADRYEARLAGSEQFAETSERLLTLSYAAHLVHQDQYDTWASQSRLVADFAAATVARAEAFDEALRRQLVEGEWQRGGEVFDTHPPHQERVAKARHEQSEGIFTSEEPAATLFGDFERLARKVTLHYYRNDLQLDLGEENLMSLDSFADATVGYERERAALQQFFHQVHCLDAPVALELPQEPLNPERTLAKLRETCIRQRFAVEVCRQLLQDYALAYGELSGAMMAHALLKAGFTIDPEEFALESGDIGEAARKCESALTEEGRLLERLHSQSAPAYNRLQLGLSLLGGEAAADAAAQRGDVVQLLTVQQALCRVGHSQLTARHCNDVLRTLLLNQSNSGDSRLAGQVTACMGELHRLLRAMRKEFAGRPYPFEHYKQGLSIADYLFGEDELPDHPQRLSELADGVDARLHLLGERVLGRLCAAALGIEEMVGVNYHAEEIAMNGL